jgi:hypothetical protein
MKNYFLTLLILMLGSLSLSAQEMRGPDASPMDMAYFPDDYAHDIRFAPDELEFNRPIIRVIYSRPAQKGRDLFGELVPYGKVWRVGANEAPEIRFYEDVMLDGKRVEAGDYALLAIPSEDTWTIILSEDVDQWGAYSYDESKDVLRVQAKTSQLEESVENFAIQFEGKGKGIREGTMHMAWSETLVSLPFSF